MDAEPGTATAPAQQQPEQREMPSLADATVYAIDVEVGPGGGEPGSGGKRANEMAAAALPQSNATPSPAEEAAAVERGPGRRAGEDSHFDSSLSGPAEPAQLLQFTDSDGGGGAVEAPGGDDVKDPRSPERPAAERRKREHAEASEANRGEPGERLLPITALASGGAAAAATLTNTITSTTTTPTTPTTTTTTKKCPLEIGEGAEKHNTLGTVVGDHGAAAVACVSPPQQVVYVRSEDALSTAGTTPLVRCSADPRNSNVVRIQIIPASDAGSDYPREDPGQNGTGGAVPGGCGPAGSSGVAASVSSVSSAASPTPSAKCPGAKVVTVVSVGGDSGVVLGDGVPPERTFDLGAQETTPGAPAADEAVPCAGTRVLVDAGGDAQGGTATGDDTLLAPLTEDMVQKNAMTLAAVADGSSTYVYYLGGPRSGSAGAGSRGSRGSSSGASSSSGQCSPSDMLDSGTCSDIEVTPPPLPKKMSQRAPKATTPAAASPPPASLAALAIKHGPGPVPAALDKTTPTTDAVINQRASEPAPALHHHHLEFQRLHHNQTHQQPKQPQPQPQLLLDDDEPDERYRRPAEDQHGQNGAHQTHGDLTQNGFSAHQQQQLQQLQQQQAGSVSVSDSDGSESCLSCDSLNFEHLQQPGPPAADLDVPAPPADEVKDLLGSEGATAGATDADLDLERPAQRRSVPGRVPPFLAGNVCGLPDSLLAAIRESRPKVYCGAEERAGPQEAQHEPPGEDRHGGGANGHERVSMVEQLELLEPATATMTTRSILMDKINSLEQSMQARFAGGDQPDASSNHHHQLHQHLHQGAVAAHHAINSECAGRAQSSCSTAGSLTTDSVRSNHFESDRFYKFHIHEHVLDGPAGGASSPETTPSVVDDDESFAGLKDLSNGTSTIRSNKGTVRGVKNRVRNGIATFLQMQQTGMKNYKDKEAGKVVVYSTSMGIVRETYTKCMNVKQILRTLLIKFEEKDIFMSSEYQQEIRERMQTDTISIPQVFVDGQHVGDAECIERLNESGELRKMLKPYKCLESPYMCKVCGGYRLLPCPSCGGSKKSIHRNHFTAEFIALKCMNCDEVGLVKCHNC